MTQIATAARVPMPWYALYEFGRQIYMGCAAAFGRHQVRRVNHPRTVLGAPELKLTVTRNGRETARVHWELPRISFEPQRFAALIADAVSEGLRAQGE